MSDFNITLEKVKPYLRVLHTRDDVLIQSFIKVALLDVQNFIDRQFIEVDQKGKPTLIDADGNIPPPLEAAVYMIVQDLYTYRATQSDKGYFSNPTFERLVFPYRRMGV